MFVTADIPLLKEKTAVFLSGRPAFSNYYGFDLSDTQYVELPDTLVLRKTYESYCRIYFLSNSAIELKQVLNGLTPQDIINIPSKSPVDQTLHVPFYEQTKAKQLSDFPVINKNLIKEHQDQLVSSVVTKNKLFKVHTSGSTGTPMMVYQDKNKTRRLRAEMIYLWQRAGFKIGMKYVFFRVWTTMNRKSQIRAFVQNLVMDRLNGCHIVVKKSLVKCCYRIRIS